MPHIYYDFTINGIQQIKILKDITVNVRFIKEILENVTVYDEYDIMDGETPEVVAGKIYGNTQYHWVIMLANDIYDYREDWPVDGTTLPKRVTQIYGAGNEYATHHYEATEGIDADYHVVNSDWPGAYAVSNFEYEDRLNESKRRIKIITKDVLDIVLKEYSKLFE